MNDEDPLAALRRWPAGIDIWIQRVGFLVANLGFLSQVLGLIFGLLLSKPILGERCLEGGFWVAGLGGAAVAYGLYVDAGGSVRERGGPRTYVPPQNRWLKALGAVIGIPLFAALSWPLGVMLYATLIIGGSLYALAWLFGWNWFD